MTGYTASRTARSLAAGFVLVAGLAACGSNDSGVAAPAATPSAAPGTTSTPSGDEVATASGSVTAEDQTSDGTSLRVSEVTLEGVEQGFIGVHQDLDGKPGPVVGIAQVQKGTTGDLVVTFDQPVKTGAFWPMLHVDDNTIGTYEFTKVEGADLPVKDGDKVVMKKVTLTVG